MPQSGQIADEKKMLYATVLAEVGGRLRLFRHGPFARAIKP